MFKIFVKYVLSTSCFSSFHTKSMIYFSRSLEVWIGIEKISIRYHSLNKIKMLTKWIRPIRDSFLGFQNAPLTVVDFGKLYSENYLWSVFISYPKSQSKHLIVSPPQSKGLPCLFSTYQWRAIQFSDVFPSRLLLTRIDDYAKEGGPEDVRLLCSFYHESFRTWIKTIVNKFAFSNRTALILGVHALRSYLKLIFEYELHSLPNKKVSGAKGHGKNYIKVRPPLVCHLLRDRLFL